MLLVDAFVKDLLSTSGEELAVAQSSTGEASTATRAGGQRGSVRSHDGPLVKASTADGEPETASSSLVTAKFGPPGTSDQDLHPHPSSVPHASGDQEPLPHRSTETAPVPTTNSSGIVAYIWCDGCGAARGGH
jgi:hypothetical protein